jgi:hypothetical protein
MFPNGTINEPPKCYPSGTIRGTLKNTAGGENILKLIHQLPTKWSNTGLFEGRQNVLKRQDK